MCKCVLQVDYSTYATLTAYFYCTRNHRLYHDMICHRIVLWNLLGLQCVIIEHI